MPIMVMLTGKLIVSVLYLVILFEPEIYSFKLLKAFLSKEARAVRIMHYPVYKIDSRMHNLGYI